MLAVYIVDDSQMMRQRLMELISDVEVSALVAKLSKIRRETICRN